MTNFDLWKILNFIVGKDVYANVVSAPEMELELQAKNLRYFRQRLGFPESYAPGQPSPTVIDHTRLLQTDLKPFYVTVDVPVAEGIAEIENWFYIEDFYTKESRSADIISRQEVSSRLRDAQTKPTTKDIVAYIDKRGLIVYPQTLTTITVLYIKKPSDPKFVISTNPTTLEYVYNSASSQELEWDDMNKLDILHMILSDMGIHIERNEVVAYAEQLVKTGN